MRQLLHLIKNFIYFIVFSNLLVAFSAMGLTYLNLSILDIDNYKSSLLILIFCATFNAYNFQRLIRINKTKRSQSSIRLFWIKSNKKLLIVLNIIILLIGIYNLLYLPTKTLFVLIPMGILSVWYVLGFKNKKALREMPFLKLFVIGLVWSFSTFGLPTLLEVKAESEFSDFLFFVGLSLFLMSQAIPFDIRDIQYDNSLKLKTLPNYLGIKKSKILSVFGFSIAAILFIILGWTHAGKAHQILYNCYALGSLFAIPLVNGINKYRKELYYSALIESIVLFPVVAYFFWTNLF